MTDKKLLLRYRLDNNRNLKDMLYVAEKIGVEDIHFTGVLMSLSACGVVSRNESSLIHYTVSSDRSRGECAPVHFRVALNKLIPFVDSMGKDMFNFNIYRKKAKIVIGLDPPGTNKEVTINAIDEKNGTLTMHLDYLEHKATDALKAKFASCVVDPLKLGRQVGGASNMADDVGIRIRLKEHHVSEVRVKSGYDNGGYVGNAKALNVLQHGGKSRFSYHPNLPLRQALIHWPSKYVEVRNRGGHAMQLRISKLDECDSDMTVTIGHSAIP